MGHAETLDALLQHGSGAAPAFGTPGAPSLTYDALRALVGATVQRLNRWGVGRNDRVAIVLPSGPQMAAALCAVAAGATAAPLNPAYRADEFHFYLTDLQPKMLIVEASVPSPARSIDFKVDYVSGRHCVCVGWGAPGTTTQRDHAVQDGPQALHRLVDAARAQTALVQEGRERRLELLARRLLGGGRGRVDFPRLLRSPGP